MPKKQKTNRQSRQNREGGSTRSNRQQPAPNGDASTKNALYFFVKFTACFALLYAIMRVLPLAPWLEFIAQTQAFLLQLFGVGAQSSSSIVLCGAQQFEIIADCSGLVMVSLLAALLYATGARNLKKTLAWGVPVLLAFNIVRLLATLYLSCTAGPDLLEATHFAFWIVDALVVIAIWAYSQKIRLA